MAQKWKYSTCYAMIRKVEKGLTGGIYVDPKMIWTEKDKNGKTTWDQIKEFGEKGWELVSATPITEESGNSSYTRFILYTFKQPIEE